MKKIFAAILTVILSLFLLFIIHGCFSSEAGTTIMNNYIVGQIQMVGSEPFTNLALRNETSVYLLNCSGSVKDSIYHNQGQLAKVYFDSIYTNKDLIRVLKVEKVDVISGSKK